MSNHTAERMYEIQLITYFFFSEGELCFWKWMPLNHEQSIKFTKNGISYQVFINPEYEGTFTFKPDLDKIDRGGTWVRALKVIVEFDVNSKTKAAIDRNEPPDELISEIASFFSKFEDSIRDIVRNDLGQYWLSHPYHDPEENNRDILGGLHFRNPTTNEMEQFLHGATIRLDSPIPVEHILIDESKWKKLGELIDKQYRSDLALVCLSNAFSLAKKNKNYRLALIEAVISLERAVFVYLPAFIQKIDQDKARPFLNSESVIKAVENLLPLVSKQLKIDDNSIKLCSDAIKLRNQIIHRTRHKIDPALVEKQISCIGTVVRKIVPHQL